MLQTWGRGLSVLMIVDFGGILSLAPEGNDAEFCWLDGLEDVPLFGAAGVFFWTNVLLFWGVGKDEGDTLLVDEVEDEDIGDEFMVDMDVI